MMFCASARQGSPICKTIAQILLLFKIPFSSCKRQFKCRNGVLKWLLLCRAFSSPVRHKKTHRYYVRIVHTGIGVCTYQGCQVRPFRDKKTKFLKQLAFVKVYRSLYSKTPKFFFLKTEFGIFQLQAPWQPWPI